MPASIKEDHPDGLCYTLVNHVARLGCKDIWEMQPLGSATADSAEERAPSLERAAGGGRQLGSSFACSISLSPHFTDPCR